MTEERLKEIKDSIELQAIYVKEHNFETTLLDEEADLYNEVISLQAEIKELNDSVIWWTNRFNAVERDKREYKTRIDKAIEYIEKNQEKQYAMNYEYGLTYNELPKLIDILQGSDKE